MKWIFLSHAGILVIGMIAYLIYKSKTQIEPKPEMKDICIVKRCIRCDNKLIAMHSWPVGYSMIFTCAACGLKQKVYPSHTVQITRKDRRLHEKALDGLLL